MMIDLLGTRQTKRRKLGLYLVKVYNATPYGRWGGVLKRLGISRTTAWRLMKAVESESPLKRRGQS